MSLFNSASNRQLIVNTLAKHFKTRTGFIIGEDELELVDAVIDKLYNENTSEDLPTINKHAIGLIHDIINKKRVQQIEEINVPTPLQPNKVVSEAEAKLESIVHPNNVLIQHDYVVVDSRLRDHTIYPSPNRYRFMLPTEYHNITEIEMITAEIPKSCYNINTSNNVILFQEIVSHVSTSSFVTATILPGDYTLAELKSALESSMNTASTTGAIFSVDTITLSLQSKLIISSDLGGTATLFNILISSIFPVIGFSNSDKTGSASYTASSRYNLNPESYIVLKLNEVPSDVRSSHSLFDNSFAKISLGDSPQGSTKFFSAYSDYNAITVINPPMSSLPYLDISFYDYSGLHEFNGLDHSMTFKITYVNSNLQ
jgi:hypothetical protein